MPLPAGSIAATGADAQACAAAVLEALPALMNALRARLRRQIGEGLSVPQFRCLNFVDANAGASISQVAAFLGVSLATASAMVDRLVRGGYVLAGTAAEDRRRSRLALSAGGRAVLRRIRRGAQRELAAALAGRPGAELAALRQGLEVLRAAFATEPR